MQATPHCLSVEYPHCAAAAPPPRAHPCLAQSSSLPLHVCPRPNALARVSAMREPNSADAS